ncbi:MAG TPA: pyruvate, phosphate dikinase [Candidatus Thermoplasmatota archaeon]|nr:pyruvate, phosphate dikinase [Candidatus Thermoplasmatota archaeon]
MSAVRLVYSFDEGSAQMKALLGGKGAGLAEMTRIGLGVPPGFIITTEACLSYLQKGTYPLNLREQVTVALHNLEKLAGRKLGDPEAPLTLSVRSGAAVSMPGMMDTVLNLGLTRATVGGLVKMTGDERFAFDSYRRFLQMFGDVVLGIPHEAFEEVIAARKKSRRVKADTELKGDDWKEVASKFEELISKKTGKALPDDPVEHLWMAIRAVFDSWNNKRAIEYRRIHKIADNLGTAVSVQAMVYGNQGADSGTGVAFTRDPSTGEKAFFGEFLLNAQGEDVVAGTRTPEPIEKLKDALPAVFEQLVRTCQTLERHYREMQDIEFTIERGRLYMLQTRTGKRSAQAAVRIAVDMVGEGLITREEALRRVTPHQIEKLLHRTLDPTSSAKPIARGLAASPGVGTGRVVFDADDAVAQGSAGWKVILTRVETTPEDIHGINVAQGILTGRGGMTSHAAVVARGMGKPCVAGCEQIVVDTKGKLFTAQGGVVVHEGDEITIDGASGSVYLGRIATIEPEVGPAFRKVLAWAEEFSRLQVWANADTPADAERARAFGAQGVGLCRTEHMFFGEERLPWIQAMIMARSLEERQAALAKLLPFQREDFKGILRAMHGLPVVIRLLDPPLHEFLPDFTALKVQIALARERHEPEAEVAKTEAVLRKVEALKEFNPMLGFRGCRLGMLYPEIFEMQVRAIAEAALELKDEGVDARPEIMVPLVGHVNEMRVLREMIEGTLREVGEARKRDASFKIGTMIEVPRAALTADEIARFAEFFSFGTNDLTQMTFGYSRDDAEGKFLFHYVENGILPAAPFQTIDREGVGKLMEMAIELGRRTRPDIKVGICGEHGGDPATVAFCHEIGLSYVSCSPFRVPVARMAAARASLGYPVQG